MSLSVPFIGQAMPRMRADLPVVRVSNDAWGRAQKRFRRIHKLGCGAFGCAYSAQVGRQKTIVKVATGAARLGVSLKTAFETLHREIVVLGKLQKFPFVPRLIEVGPDYFVQEDVGGEAADRILIRRGLEAREVLSVAIAVGIMASQIHREGIAHKDLHVGNILLTPHGVVIIDFGLAVERKESEEIWKQGLMADFHDVIFLVILATDAKDLPPGVKSILVSVIEKFQKRAVEGAVDENSCGELSKELFFIAAQIGARATRGKSMRARKVFAI